MKNYKSKLGLELIIPIFLLFGYALFELIIEKSWLGVFIMLVTISFIVYTFLCDISTYMLQNLHM